MKGLGAAATRAAERRRATEARLLDAALEVFSARGYDAATTAEIARAADVAAGTFYLHFRDKRAAYERLAREASRDLLARWRRALRAGMRVGDRVTLALRLTADFWRSDLRRARLLLEGGPSFGSEGHLRFVDEIAAALRAVDRGVGRRPLPARPLALLVAGVGIELGRLAVADPKADGDELVRLVGRSLAHLDVTSVPKRSPGSVSACGRKLARC